MPKETKSQLEKRVSIIEKMGKDTYSLTDNGVYCKICDKEISTMRLFVIRRHANSLTHKTALRILISNTSSDVIQTDKKHSTFAKDLCSALIAADIPFHKLENQVFREFLEKYTKKKIPNKSTLHKYYLQPCYNDVINAIREEINNHAIWVSIDEITDVNKRAIANVVVGTLEKDNPGKKFLLHCQQLTHVNNETIAQLFTIFLELLWPEGISIIYKV